MNSSLTLYQVNALVRSTVESELADDFWLTAEISSLSVNRNGHCYLELVEKDSRGTDIIAKAKAIIYNNYWMLLSPAFMNATGEQLRPGLKVLVSARVSFHELYGYSLIIGDIDPTYTLGDLAQHRQMIVNALRQAGIFDLNKELILPELTKRIAVISSATAAGYGDFCNQLSSNPYGFQFSVGLFPAVMQGSQVEESVIAALDSIANERDQWDCVVIIRGGGATSDLASFDSLPLAECVANFPLPIITGIGHERDDTVLDMISFRRVKTPTAAAEFLIAHANETYSQIVELSQRLTDSINQRIMAEREQLTTLSLRLPTLFESVKLRQESLISNLSSNLTNVITMRMVSEKHSLQLLEQQLEAVNPDNILKRGYSLTLTSDGKVVRSAKNVKPGEEITTRLSDGEIHSVIK